jgi:hypothetical protein
MSRVTYDYETKVLAGPVVRMSGQFLNWFGTITVRPDDEGNPVLSYSSYGYGKLPRKVEALAIETWREEVQS